MFFLNGPRLRDSEFTALKFFRIHGFEKLKANTVIQNESGSMQDERERSWKDFSRNLTGFPISISSRRHIIFLVIDF